MLSRTMRAVAFLSGCGEQGFQQFVEMFPQLFAYMLGIRLQCIWVVCLCSSESFSKICIRPFRRQGLSLASSRFRFPSIHHSRTLHSAQRQAQRRLVSRCPHPHHYPDLSIRLCEHRSQILSTKQKPKLYQLYSDSRVMGSKSEMPTHQIDQYSQ